MKSFIKNTWFIFLPVIIALIINLFFFRISFVIGSSMEPTFNNGDMIVMSLNKKNINRYDVIICKPKDEKILIKRVIGLPGETIQIVNNNIYINHKIIPDKVDVVMDDYGCLSNPLTLGEDEYMILGDNRNNSKDGRTIGPVSINDIMGVVTVGIVPPKKIN